MMRIHRNTARLGGTDIFYFDTRTDGPAILCLHGRWGRAETWVDFIRHYGEKYRVVAPDQRGHGLSGKPDSLYSAEEMAGDMAELLDYLHIGAAVVVGHSMGGRVAGHFAALHPKYVRALAILDKSASGTAKHYTLDADLSEDPLTKDWPMPFPSLRDAMDFIRGNQDSEWSRQYFMNSLVETAEGCRMLFSPRAMARNIAGDGDWFHLLPKIKCPALIVRSSSHEGVTDEDLAKMQSLLPDCIAREVSHPDHNVHLSRQDEFCGYIDELLGRV
jgi:pimeloyl-ACP methyl ester carboxylesterase